MRERFLLPVKWLAGALPGVPELYWRWTHDRLDPYPDFKLDRLAAALPGWSQAVERQSRGLEAEPPKRVAIFAFLHWWIAHAASLGLVLRALGHEVSLFGLSYRDWWVPNEPFYLRQRGAYLRDVMSLGGSTLPFVDLTADRGRGLPTELEEAMAAQSEIDVQYTLQREDLDFGRQEEQAAAPQVPIDPAERGVLCSVLAKPELVPCVLARGEMKDFQDARVRRILEQCIELYDREGDIDHAELAAALQDTELAALVAEIVTSELGTGNWEPWLQDCLARLEERAGRAEMRRLTENVAREAGGYDRDALAALQEHYRRRAGHAPPADDDGQ